MPSFVKSWVQVQCWTLWWSWTLVLPAWIPGLVGTTLLFPAGCPCLSADGTVLVVWRGCLLDVHPTGASWPATLEGPPCWVPWNQLGKVYDTILLGGLGSSTVHGIALGLAKLHISDLTWLPGVILLGTHVPHGSWLGSSWLETCCLKLSKL